MAKEQSRALGRLTCALALATAVWPASAQGVYKWVDAQGRTHYSERKPETQPASALELKVTPPGTRPPAQMAVAEAAPAPPARTSSGPAPQPRHWALSDGRDHGTDASRCALARDVLSGAVQHRNGKPTDAYDREVAQSDVSLFCKP